MNINHQYKLTLKWTGNKGQGTNDYAAYERSHNINIENKVELQCSSDAPFRGDYTKHSPEDFFLASVSSCHMLWYLHLCADSGIVVLEYTDFAEGILSVFKDKVGCFTKVILNPLVIVSESSMIEKAIELHNKANQNCFIANSLNFKVDHIPTIKSIKEK
ncbi:MAG: OsmC family protein [Candidatus Kapaibacterium sp.]